MRESGARPRELARGRRGAHGLADLEEEAILRQYRPVWDFDVSETLFPISLEEWAALGERVVGVGGGSAAYADPASLLAAVQTFPTGTMETALEPFPGLPPCVAGAGCNDAPVFVDAVPVGFTLEGHRNLVWLHYWLLYHYDLKLALPGSDQRPQHYGDWEHVYVLASLDDLGDPDARTPTRQAGSTRGSMWRRAGMPPIATPARRFPTSVGGSTPTV